MDKKPSRVDLVQGREFRVSVNSFTWIPEGAGCFTPFPENVFAIHIYPRGLF